MIELKAQPRTLLGSQVKNLRKKGYLPGVVYGEGVESQSIVASFIDFERVLARAGESTLVTLDMGGKKYNVLIHDVAYDPLKGSPIHADFYAVRMDKVINATVPFEFTGESSAVKNDGGILVKIMHEIEVEALPQDLPHELRVDLGLLSIFGSKVLVKDIISPKGVTMIADSDKIIVLVEAPRLVEAEEQTPALGTVAEVKTEQEERREAKAKKEEVKEE